MVSESVPSWLKALQITYQPLWQEIYYLSLLTSKKKPRRVIISQIITTDSLRQVLHLKQTRDHCREKPKDVWAFCQCDRSFPTSSLGFFPQNVKGTGLPNHNMVAAAAATKSRQSCPTLFDPIDGSLPGFPVPGILQARTLEWVAISFSNAWKWKVKGKSLSRVQL